MRPQRLPDRSERKVQMKSLSRVQLFATPWTVACQAPPSLGFSRQEYWSGLPFPSPGDLPHLGTEPGSPALEADALTSEPQQCILLEDMFLLLKNLLTNPVILKCKLWEWI